MFFYNDFSERGKAMHYDNEKNDKETEQPIF